MRQTTALFFILMIVGSQATTFLNTNKQQIIGELNDRNSEFYQLLEEGSQYVVDEVLNLLKNLEDASRNDLAALIKAFKIEEAMLEKVLADATAAYNKQVQQCNFLESQQHALERSIEIRRQEFAKNAAKIAENTQQIKNLRDERCKANELFINHVIAHRDALLLFNLLSKAIDSYKPGSFVQLDNINNAAQTLSDYINHYANTNVEEFNKVMAQLTASVNLRSMKNQNLLNTKLASSGSRVANKQVNNYAGNSQYKTVGRVQQRDTKNLKSHIDNQSNQISLDKLNQDTVRALANVKGQLLQVIGKLTSDEQKSRDQAEQAEATAAQTFATVKSRLQDENRRLQRRNEALQLQLDQLKVRLDRKIKQVKACRVQEAKLLAAKNLAQKNLDEARARFRARKAVLEGQIALFTRLHAYYRERVYNTATKADRERVDDFAKNKNFNKSQRTRQAAAYNGLNVDKFAKDGSNKEVGAFKGF